MGRVCKGQTRPRTKGQASSAHQFGGTTIYVHTLWGTTTKFGVVTYMGTDVFRGSPRSHPKGAGKSSPILGFSLFIPATFVVERQVRRGNINAAGFVFKGGVIIPRYHLKWSGLQRIPIFGYSSTFAHTPWRTTTKFGVTTPVGRAMFWGQPRHYILRKCIARFQFIVPKLKTTLMYT